MQPAQTRVVMLHHAHRVVTIRKSRPSGKRKLIPSHDTLENPQNTHNRTASESPGKDQEAGKRQEQIRMKQNETSQRAAYFAEEEYLVTALVPSETACLASSPGRMRRTEVWISREEMVDFLL